MEATECQKCFTLYNDRTVDECPNCKLARFENSVDKKKIPVNKQGFNKKYGN